jgi:uncharacterized membrane protein
VAELGYIAKLKSNDVPLVEVSFVNKVSSCIFYSLWIAYAIYSVLWLAGFTFSYGANDKPSELLFAALTFIVDIPIFWLINKNLKMGLSLLAITVACSLALAFSAGILNSFSYSFWYAPKILIAGATIWSNLSRQKRERTIILRSGL